MLEYLKNKKIMIVVAHPDDEVIGIGASIHKLANEYNCNIKCVILGEGVTSRDESRDPELRKKELQLHKKNIFLAKKIIGYSELSLFGFPDNRFDSIPILDIIKVVEKEKISFSPEVIFTHHGGDLNIDHQITFKAVVTASRPTKNESVKSILSFETFSGTEWQVTNHPQIYRPNLYIEISKENLEAKKLAMESYFLERRDFPHPRSSESLEISAQKNGITVGYKLAESFCIIRIRS
jgi:LmbE family N-acetylglucosaminyl deacetylase